MTAVGLCQCGCGQPTNIAKRNRPERGHIKGQQVRYLKGHINHARWKGHKPQRYVIEDRGYTTPCWIWQRALSKGYGSLGYGGKAYRVMWEKANGPVPDGLHLDHLCRVTECVNPDHLEPVPPRENTRRGRATKLTLDQVREIIAADEPYDVLAARFGVRPTTIWRIRRRASWRVIDAGVANVPEGPITPATIKALTPEQADRLVSACGDVVEAREKVGA